MVEECYYDWRLKCEDSKNNALVNTNYEKRIENIIIDGVNCIMITFIEDYNHNMIMIEGLF